MTDQLSSSRDCEVCGEQIQPGEGFVHHPRLNVYVHWDCPKTNVRGEDISMHTVLVIPPEGPR